LYANTGPIHLHKLLTLNNKLLCILQNKSYYSLQLQISILSRL